MEPGLNPIWIQRLGKAEGMDVSCIDFQALHWKHWELQKDKCLSGADLESGGLKTINMAHEKG